MDSLGSCMHHDSLLPLAFAQITVFVAGYLQNTYTIINVLCNLEQPQPSPSLICSIITKYLGAHAVGLDGFWAVYG